MNRQEKINLISDIQRNCTLSDTWEEVSIKILEAIESPEMTLAEIDRQIAGLDVMLDSAQKNIDYVKTFLNKYEEQSNGNPEPGTD